MKIESVQIDGCRCTGHRLCLSEAPKVLRFDSQLDQAQINDEAEEFFSIEAENILSAAAVCPMNAIVINGRRHFGNER